MPHLGTLSHYSVLQHFDEWDDFCIQTSFSLLTTPQWLDGKVLKQKGIVGLSQSSAVMGLKSVLKVVRAAPSGSLTL